MLPIGATLTAVVPRLSPSPRKIIGARGHRPTTNSQSSQAAGRLTLSLFNLGFFLGQSPGKNLFDRVA